MYHMTMSDHQKGISKFGPSFDPSLWRHRGSQWGQWRHQSKDRQKVIKHGKFKKILWSRFYGPQKEPIYCSAEKNGPLAKMIYAHAAEKRFKIFFFRISFHSIQEKKIFHIKIKGIFSVVANLSLCRCSPEFKGEKVKIHLLRTNLHQENFYLA